MSLKPSELVSDRDRAKNREGHPRHIVSQAASRHASI
jgi:hypothetical protein